MGDETKRPKDLARVAVVSHLDEQELLRQMDDLSERIEAVMARGDAALQALAPYLRDGERLFVLVESFWDGSSPATRWAKRALELNRRGGRVYGQVHELVEPDRLRPADAAPGPGCGCGCEDDEARVVGLQLLDAETA